MYFVKEITELEKKEEIIKIKNLKKQFNKNNES